MKKLLALDLGITTGFAVYEVPTGSLLEYGVIDYPEFETRLKELRDRWIVSYSVAEVPVIMRGALGNQLAEVVAITSRELMRQVDLVDPASWKQTPYRKLNPPPGKLTPHERDAIRLGAWYHATRLQGSLAVSNIGH